MEREDIYKERNSIEEFGVDEKNTLNNALFDVLFNIDYISTSGDIENYILGLFNDAYYICTLILLEKRPYFKVNKYKSIIGADKNSITLYDANKVILVMSMVYDYLKTLNMISFDIDKTTNIIRNEFSGCDGNVFETISSVLEIKEWSTEACTFFPLNYPKDEQFSDYWKNYHDFPNEMASFIKSHIETRMEAHTTSEDDVRQIVRGYGIKNEPVSNLSQLHKYAFSGGSFDIPDQHKEGPCPSQSEFEELERKYQALLAEFDSKPEEAFNPSTKNRCFSKNQIGLLVYTIATIKDGPIPTKTDLVPIISSICGSEIPSTDIAMRYAGFRKADIEYVATVFENAMPKFADEIRKLPERKPKEKM